MLVQKHIWSQKYFSQKMFCPKKILAHKNKDPQKIGCTNFGQNRVSNSWTIPDMDKCRHWWGTPILAPWKLFNCVHPTFQTRNPLFLKKLVCLYKQAQKFKQCLRGRIWKQEIFLLFYWLHHLIRSFMSFLPGGQSSTNKLVLQFVYIFIVPFPVWAGIKINSSPKRKWN